MRKLSSTCTAHQDITCKVQGLKSGAFKHMCQLNSACYSPTTKARWRLDTLSASSLAFCSVVAASWLIRDSSSALVNKPSSIRMSPSQVLISQKFENTRFMEYIIFDTISAAVISRNCMAVSMNPNSRRHWMAGNSVRVVAVKVEVGSQL
jgi:hypothetical protein